MEGVLNGNRTVLSRAITLVESTNPGRRELGRAVLEEVMPKTGRSMRIGITGVPGAGKSTLIETMGQAWLNRGEKVAVLAIDPSSSRTRGSILGDKTRMPALASDERAYIRPTPTSGNLGGVARTSRETMLLCEAAGYSRILLETVGVGQSETTVHSMVDFFLLVLIAGAGDELQGIKRGVMEMADLIAINKAEEGNLEAARQARQSYENALSLFPPSESGWKPPVVTCSAIQGHGVEELLRLVDDYESKTRASGYFELRRQDQAIRWMHETIVQEMKDRFYADDDVLEMISDVESGVRAGSMSPFQGANLLLARRGSSSTRKK